jgi:hypothetical protein
VRVEKNIVEFQERRFGADGAMGQTKLILSAQPA